MWKTSHQSVFFVVAALIILTVPFVLNAQEQSSSSTSHSTEHAQHSSQGEASSGSGCEQMAQMHKDMMSKMKEMDTRLEEKVSSMNSTSGEAKVNAIAAVVTELVNQRKEMHQRMMSMNSKTMGHMGMHMGKGGQESMMNCPMMKQMESDSSQ